MSKITEDREIKTVYLHADQIREAEVLIKKNYYGSLSDLVRKLIDKEYKAKIKDPEEELKKAISERDELIASLQQMIKETSNSLKTWSAKYAERRSNMSITVLSSPKYEEQSKKWIKANLSELNKVYPGQSIDEIYGILEETVRKEEYA